MIQFNLLPDVKIKYIKTQRTKRTVMLVSVIVGAASIALVTVLFLTVQVVQKKNLNDLSKDIVKQTKQLQEVQDLDKILTIQNQLSALPALNDSKPVSSRILKYLPQVTPATASISALDVDFDTNTFTITGNADSAATVNKYVDTLKFATYTSSKTQNGKPFSDVVTTVTVGAAGSDPTRKAAFLLKFTFDPILFSNTETPEIVVPKIISSRSETEKPSAIFKEGPKPVPAKAAN